MIKADIDRQADYEEINKQLQEKCAAQEALIIKLQNEKKGKGGKAPLSNLAYDFLTNLQYKVKDLTAQVSDFKSGEKYVKMEANYKEQLAWKDREIKNLKRELELARRQTVDVRNMWMQANDDLVKEHALELSQKDRIIEALEKQLLNVRYMLGGEREKFRDKVRELYEVKTELEDEKGKNLKLKAQINRDYENSSTPSSLKPSHKKIANNREKTDKKPGGQPGHEGYLRKKHIPTNIIDIPAPEKYANSPDYKPTGKTITKQMVDIRVEIIVNEYSTPEFRNVLTGQRVHADFPENLVNDVNYSGNIKAFAFLLNNHCNVSLEKVSDFLFELTDGELSISTGMINGLSKEFSIKTEADQKRAFAEILLSPVMNSDFTSARVNGRNMNVAVCSTPSVAMYFAREHKGHEGIKGTPIEDYRGIMVHDHDKTYYSYGDGHQECLDHVSRYLKDSMDNEPALKWNRQMRELIKEMIHFKNSLDPDDKRNPDEIDPVRVGEFKARYDEILQLAKTEYEYEPPSKYYKDGFNLYIRLVEYKDSHLLFLHDRRVPHTNNLSERLLRVFKRKQKQVMVFRSFDGLDNLCNSIGTTASLRAQNKNLFHDVASIFELNIGRGGQNIVF